MVRGDVWGRKTPLENLPVRRFRVIGKSLTIEHEDWIYFTSMVGAQEVDTVAALLVRLGCSMSVRTEWGIFFGPKPQEGLSCSYSFGQFMFVADREIVLDCTVLRIVHSTSQNAELLHSLGIRHLSKFG
jgi:hypothetical protein